MGLSRSDVIAAGLEIASKDGAEGLGVFSVARRLRIKPPSLYNHVTSNADLHHAVAVAGYRRMADHLRGKAAAVPCDDPAGELRRLARSFRRFALRNSRLYAFLAAAELDPTDPECVETIARLLEPFERALAALGYRRADAVHALRGLRAALHGFVVLELSGQLANPPATSRSFELLLDALVRAPAPGRGGDRRP